MKDKINYKLSFINDELIFAVWFWLFSFIKIPASLYEKSEFQLVAISTIVLFLVGFFKRIRIYRVYFAMLVVCIFLMVSYFLHGNFFTFYYMTKFIFYSMVSVYFMARIKDTKKCLFYLSILACVSLMLYIRDPLNGYIITKNYMGFGFLISLPSFLCIRVGRKYLKIKYLLPFEIVAFLAIFLYSNRSSILSIIGFYLLEILFLEEKSLKSKTIKLGGIFFSGLLLYLNFKIIIEKLLEIVVKKNGYHSRILLTLHAYFENKSVNGLTAGRLNLWDKFYEIFKEHIFFGNEIGVYERHYGIYIHNILMDFLLQFGIVGTIVLVIIIIKSFWNIIKYSYFDRLFGILLFSLWFPKLMFSLSFWLDNYFWMFLCYGLFNRDMVRKILEGEKC